jgi:NADH dehydrogenase
MTGIDRKNKLVFLAATYDEDGREITPVRSFKYDTLVIAIGCVGNEFSTPGVKEHAIMLDTPEEAERFNRRLINACVRAFAQAEPIRPVQLHVAIIGAGATGTELAAELHQTARGLVAYGLDRIDPEKDIKFTLVERRTALSGAARAHLEAVASRAAGVDIRTGARVMEDEGVALSDGSLSPSSSCGRRASRGPRCSPSSTAWR